MSDYNFRVHVLRGEMATALADNEEQFLYVLTEALTGIDPAEVCALGRVSEEADAEICATQLRYIADQIDPNVENKP